MASEVEFLRNQVGRCRRLAAEIEDRVARDALEALADEYQRRIDTLMAGQTMEIRPLQG